MPPFDLDPPATRADAALDALDALDARDARDVLDGIAESDVALVCAAPDGSVRLATPGWAGVVGSPAVVGTALRDAFPSEAWERAATVLRLVLTDGLARELRVPARTSRGAGDVVVRVTRSARGLLTLVAHAAPTAERRPETVALHALACQLAELPDPLTFVQALCESLHTTCGADGAVLAQQHGDQVVIVAASGVAAPAVGATVPLSGSFTEAVAASGDIVAVRDYARTSYPLAAYAARFGVGEVLAAPLAAGPGTTGVLAVWRTSGATSFTSDDRERLRVVAAYAASALDRARLAEAVEAANLARSFFLATVSHELRTPLTAISGYGELIADEIFGPLSAPQRDAIERLRAVTHQLTMQIDGILTYAGLEAGTATLCLTTVSPTELLDSVVQVIEPMARHKGLALDVDVPPDAPTVLTDLDKARHILLNLAANAVKFAEQGRVRLALVADAQVLRLSVADSGIGIAPADVGRLFRPFAQLDTGLTRRHGGTGIGLYISRRLAEMLGGRIEVESTPGAGSRFTLVLPRPGAGPEAGHEAGHEAVTA